MKDILAGLFRFCFPREVRAGDVFEFREDNPFERQFVKVLEVKQGWVGYQFEGTSTEWHLSVRSFNSHYRFFCSAGEESINA